MDRLFAGGTVNAAQSGQGAAPALFLFHSLLSDRASFDAVVPKLSPSFRLIVPELPGFGASKAVSGGLAGHFAGRFGCRSRSSSWFASRCSWRPHCSTCRWCGQSSNASCRTRRTGGSPGMR